MPFLLLLLFILFRVALLFAAAWLMTVGVPQVLADPDHFAGWLSILVALGLAVGSGSSSFKVNS